MALIVLGAFALASRPLAYAQSRPAAPSTQPQQQQQTPPQQQPPAQPQQNPPAEQPPQQAPPQSQQPPVQQPSQQPVQHQPLQQPAAPAPPVHVYSGPTIVLDPGHGGTDSGARGGSGAVEKNIVLEYARVVRGELERQGYRVLMTRSDDSNPSYDDRAAVANASRNAIFITLHVSTNGAAGTACVYYYQFASSVTGPPAALDQTVAKPAPPAVSLANWQQAQLPHVDSSHKLADLLQLQLVQHFAGSPTAASAVPVRELRSVDAPAVAIELSSVSISDPSSLAAYAAPLAESIVHALEAFRPAPAGGD